MPDIEPVKIWTVGHSNHAIDGFLDLLSSQAITLLADVRRFPGSKRHPQFGQEYLNSSLAEAGIDYRHFPDLGGRRSKRLPDSPNTAWRLESFNAYADYTQSSEFQTALAELIALAQNQNTAIMCAEALPWRCHRRLIADALIAKGFKVFDILSARQTKEHTLTEFARIEEDQVTYPGGTLF
jgi:uncharacterized protein (DUF488 family)